MFGFFEECFGGYSEELGGIGRAIFIHDRPPVPGFFVLQIFIFFAEDSRPGDVFGAVFEDGSAVGGAVFLVQLMGEFVDDDVFSVGDIGGSSCYAVPGEDDGAGLPGFTETNAWAAYHPVGGFGDIGVRIDEDVFEFWEVCGFSVEQEHAGLGGDGNFDFVGYFEAPAAFEGFFGEEYVDQFPELLLQGIGQAVIEGDIFVND